MEHYTPSQKSVPRKEGGRGLISIEDCVELEIRATDSCRDGWNVENCLSSHVQLFQDWWNVQIGDGWNVQNFLKINFLKLVKIWIWILQNLCCLTCKSTNFVLVVKPMLMLLFWLLGLCLLCMIDKIGLYALSLWYEYP